MTAYVYSDLEDVSAEPDYPSLFLVESQKNLVLSQIQRIFTIPEHEVDDVLRWLESEPGVDDALFSIGQDTSMDLDSRLQAIRAFVTRNPWSKDVTTFARDERSSIRDAVLVALDELRLHTLAKNLFRDDPDPEIVAYVERLNGR